MKKNGFTLIELIGALLIVGLISSIIIPTVMKMINSAKENTYNEQISYIEKAAEKWAVFNTKKLSELESYYLSTDDLLNEGYLDGEDIIDPRNAANEITGCVIISYDSSYSQYTYEFTTATCASLKN